jgi:hypothetical protein
MTNPRIENEAPPAPDPVTVRPDALRVVLFGMPDAGKSSLLGALAQAAQTQERTLGGRLTDLSRGLGELQHRVYDERPRETLEEIVPYPVAFEPFDGLRPDPERRGEAVLFDCDGRVANDLLSRRRAPTDDEPAGSLAAAVADADALVLVVDAGASPTQLDTDLGEFVRFLRLFRRERGARSEVGGLPVFLVLSKCDLLAQPDDTAATWRERVEAREVEVGRRFRDFLDDDDDDDDEAVAFGDLNLELAATAVKWPTLVGNPDQPREPWGVAELFHQALAAAADFRARRGRAERRLFWTVLFSGALVAGMATFAAGIFLTQSAIQPVALAAKVESYRAREGLTPSVRLTEPLQRKIGELSDLINDPEFPKLSTEQQQFLKGRLAELEAYRDYKDKLFRVRPPADARSVEDLAEMERQLRTELTPPQPYQAEWRQTDAVLLHDKWLDDIKALQRAATEIRDWYQQIAQKGNRLLLFADRTAENAPLPWPQWHESVEALLREGDRPPFRPGEKLRESRDLPGAPAVTYATVLAFPSVESARAPWERVRQRLERLHDLTQALGLGGDAGKPAVLHLPEPPRFTAEQARDVLQTLKQAYPRYAEWALDVLPDAAAPEVRQAARTSYQRAILAGQEVVRRQYRKLYPDGAETHQRWLAVADWLPKAPELQDWRELAIVLARLSDPGTEDPVTALEKFLRRDRFELDLRGLQLTIPDDLKDQRFRPQGPLVISVQDAQQPVRKLTFRLADVEGTRDPRRRVTTYAFNVEGTNVAAVRPGEAVWADVLLRDAGGSEWQFSWWANGNRSAVYQFERLTLPPRLHRPSQDGPQISAGDLAVGVGLTPVPGGGIPRVPDLLPAVR